MPKDEDLFDIALIQKGNRQGYENILNRHKIKIYNTVLNIIKNREEAEEVAQDVFVKAFQSIDTFEGNAKFSTWLHRIAYTTAISHLRSNKKRKDTVTDSTSIDVDAFGTPSIDTRQNLEKLDSKKYIKQALEQLNPEDASVISLYYLQEQSMKEIAVILDIKENATKIKLHRARKKLQEKLVTLLNVEIKELL